MIICNGYQPWRLGREPRIRDSVFQHNIEQPYKCERDAFIEMSNEDVLVVGTESAGKSVLVKRLSKVPQIKQTVLAQKHNNNRPYDITAYNNDVLADLCTIPTVGVDMTRVTVHGKEVVLREISYSLSLNFDQYFDRCYGIIFVIDAFDLGSISSASVLLHEILSEAEGALKGRSLLVVLNKVDLCDFTMIATAQNILQIDEIIRSVPHISMKYLVGSMLDNNFILSIDEWIQSIVQ